MPLKSIDAIKGLLQRIILEYVFYTIGQSNYKKDYMMKVVVYVEVDQIQPEHSTSIVLGTSLITLQFDFVQTTESFQIFNAGGVN